MCFKLIDAMGATTRKQNKTLQDADESNDFGEETLHQLTTSDKKIIEYVKHHVASMKHKRIL